MTATRLITEAAVVFTLCAAATIGYTSPLPVTLDLRAWYTADSLQDYSDGASVSAWANEASDSGLDLATVGSASPTYWTSGLNGRPAVHFSLDTPMGTQAQIGLPGDPSFTVFFAGRVTELSGYQWSHPWTWGDGSGETGHPGGCSDFEIESGDGHVRVDYATGYSRDALTPQGSFDGLIGQPVVVSFARSPGPLNAMTRIWINGVNQAITGSSLSPNLADTPFFLGPTYAQHGTRTPVMDVVDLLIYNRSLSDVEVAEVNAWLSAQLTSSVPPMMGAGSTRLVVSPNPVTCGADVRISFTTLEEAPADVAIFDVAGRLRAGVFSGVLAAGKHDVNWTAGVGSDRGLGAGIYYVRMKSPRQGGTAKLILR